MSGKVLKGILIGGAIIASAFIPGVGALAGGIFRMALLSIGSSIALNSITGQGTLNQRQGFALAGVVDTQAPLPVVYGRTKLGVRYVDKRTAGTDNVDLYIVAALCHGSQGGTGIHQIHEIYFDDRLAVASDGSIQPPFNGKLTVTKYLGTTAQTADPTLQILFPAAWPATSDGVGVAYLLLKLTFEPEQTYPTGEPTITVIVRGMKVKDPRNLANPAAYSTNPASCLYDYITSPIYGLGAAASEVDLPSFSAMATYYDTVVTKNSTTGETGKLFECNGWLDTAQPAKDNIKQLLSSCRGILVYEGGKYRLTTKRVVSPTSFTLSEANIVGDWGFSVPGIGEAPNVIHGQYVEPNPGPLVTALTLGPPVTLTTAVAHGYTTGQLLHITDWTDVDQGLTPYILGVYTADAGTTGTTIVLKDNINFTGSYTANSCRVTSENLPHSVATRIWPRPGTSNGYLTADNNYEVIQQVSLPFTNDAYTAEQILLVLQKEARAGTVITLTATEAALTLQVGDLVPVTHPTPGFVSKNFWVMGVMLDPASALVRLALQEYDSTAYTLDALSTVPTPPSTNLPNPFVCSPPGDLTLAAGDSEAETDRDGHTRLYIEATWVPAAEPYLRKYIVDYRRTGTDKWFASPDNQDQTDTTTVIGPVVEGVDYEVRVRAENTLGVVSDDVVEQIRPHLDHTHRNSSKWVEDMNADSRRRWGPDFTGPGATFTTVYDPDAIAGKRVGRITGTMVMSTTDPLPFDEHTTYVAHWRVRQRRAGSTGIPNCSIGFMGVQAIPEQPGNYIHMNAVGQDLPDNQHYVVCRNLVLPTGRGWTDLYAWVQGYAGGKVQIESSMLSHTGLGSFSAANLVNGSIDPANIGFSVDAATAGAFLHVDFGSDPNNWKSVTDARFHMSAAGSVADWDLEFSDDGTTWYKANG